MKKICIITRQLIVDGGVSSIIVNLAKAWNNIGKKDFQLEIIILDYCDVEIQRQLKSLGIPFLICPSTNRLKQLVCLIKYFARTDQNFKALCTCFKSFVFCRLANLFNRNVYLWAHAYIIKNRLKKWVVNILSNNFIIVTSKYTAQINGFENIRVLYNGVDTFFLENEGSDFYERFNVPKQSVIIGYIAHWIPIKNHKTLIKAFDLLAEQFPDLYLFCIGDKTPLTDILCKSSVYSNRIIVAGKILNAANYIRFFSVYVHTCPIEGFGLAVVEALFSKIPVIVPNSGALPELIVHNETGYVYQDPYSIAECANAISILLNDDQKAKKLAINGERWVSNQFTIERFYKNFKTLFI